MTSLRPGSYVLYTTETSPPWPAVICSEGMVPRGVQRSQNATYDVPILLLYKNECRWALPGQLQCPGDMICPEELSKDHPGLQDAYLTMLNSIVDELSLAHWKIVIDTNYEVDEGINQTPDTNKHAGKDQDLDIKRALKASLADQGKGVKRSSPTQGSSWAPMKKRRPTPELQPFPFPFRTPTRPHPSRSPSSSLSSSSGGQSSGHEFQAGNGTSALSICPQGTQSIPYEIESPVKPKGSNRKATTYSSLAVREAQDEDEMLHPKWTRWYIGPNADVFDIPMEAYLSQDHFATLIPKMPDGENGWKVFKPNFVDFDPEHFKPVAAFLTSGDFHGPLRDEQGNELDEDAIKVAALELYLGAWEIADTLCLEDMMSRIVEKLRATHWPLIEMLSFTMAIYLAPTKLDSDVDKDMRKMLLSFICHHYRDYVEQLGTIFLDRLEELPELREQVYRRMSKEARKEFGEREKE